MNNKITIFTFIAFSIGFLSLFETTDAQWVMCDGPYFTTIMSMTVNGSDLYASGNDGVYRTTNNGINFTQISNISMNCVTAMNNIIFAGNGNSGGIYTSTNNGVNWILTGLPGKIVYTLLVNGNTLYAGTSANTPPCSFWYTTNNGNNWQETNMNNIGIISIGISGNNIFVGSNNSAGVFRSTNNGINWANVGSISKTVLCFACSGNNIFAGTFRGGIYYSTNNGNNWVQKGLNNKVVRSIIINGSNIFVSTDSSGVLMSTDNGTNWINRNQGFNLNTITYPLLIANEYIFVGTSQNSVWRRSYSDIIGIKKINNEIPSAFSLNQNYPNPFNPITEIEFNLPKTSQVRLSVFSIQGKEIEAIINDRLEAGYYKAEFNGSNYSSGIYFYRIIADGFTETRKMILAK